MGWKDGLVTKSTDCSFKEPRFDSQNPQSSSESPITPVPGDLKSSFHGYQAYMWCTVTHTGKTPIHINTLSKGKRSEEGPAESILSLTPSERNHTSDHASAFRVCPFVPKAVPGCPELGSEPGEFSRLFRSLGVHHNGNELPFTPFMWQQHRI